jgi:methionyl-tRNA formyltransferase
MGTPDFAVPALHALVTAGYPLLGVYTQPPRAKGRGHRVVTSPVHESAQSLCIPVFTPQRLRDDIHQLHTLKPDLIVVVAYGQILPPEVLALPPFGCVNVHGSLLPRWRGAAPIQWALLAGDEVTGISLMKMDRGLDTGPVFSQTPYPLSPRDTCEGVIHALAHLGAQQLVTCLPGYVAGTLVPTPQPDQGVSIAPKINTPQARLTWTNDAPSLVRKVQAFHPSPGAWFTAAGKRFKVLEAICDDRPQESWDAPEGTLLDDQLRIACGENTALRILSLIPEGSRPMSGAACVMGHGFLSRGERLET